MENNYPEKFGTYFEPFLGGGAVMFNLLSKHPDMKCHVSDLNSDLILAYLAIRDKVTEVIESLENHSKKYQKNQSQYYYHVRQSEPTSQIEKVSRLIFLNKTCFNGLYRVNSKGKFNVPLGRYTNPNIINKENLLTVVISYNPQILNFSAGISNRVYMTSKKVILYTLILHISLLVTLQILQVIQTKTSLMMILRDLEIWQTD